MGAPGLQNVLFHKKAWEKSPSSGSAWWMSWVKLSRPSWGGGDREEEEPGGLSDNGRSQALVGM